MAIMGQNELRSYAQYTRQMGDDEIAHQRTALGEHLIGVPGGTFHSRCLT